jgi:hypothetical protein
MNRRQFLGGIAAVSAGGLGQAAGAGASLGLSARPAGPWASNRCFQAYSVCRDGPTSGAKSRAGRPDRRQVSFDVH